MSRRLKGWGIAFGLVALGCMRCLHCACPYTAIIKGPLPGQHPRCAGPHTLLTGLADPQQHQVVPPVHPLSHGSLVTPLQLYAHQQPGRLEWPLGWGCQSLSAERERTPRLSEHAPGGCTPCWGQSRLECVGKLIDMDCEWKDPKLWAICHVPLRVGRGARRVT
jgi:hypothetical protein